MTTTTSPEADSVSLDLKGLQPTSIYEIRTHKARNVILLVSAFVSILLPFSGECHATSDSRTKSWHSGYECVVCLQSTAFVTWHVAILQVVKCPQLRSSKLQATVWSCWVLVIASLTLACHCPQTRCTCRL